MISFLPLLSPTPLLFLVNPSLQVTHLVHLIPTPTPPLLPPTFYSPKPCSFALHKLVCSGPCIFSSYHAHKISITPASSLENPHPLHSAPIDTATLPTPLIVLSKNRLRQTHVTHNASSRTHELAFSPFSRPPFFAQFCASTLPCSSSTFLSNSFNSFCIFSN